VYWKERKKERNACFFFFFLFFFSLSSSQRTKPSLEQPAHKYRKKNNSEKIQAYSSNKNHEGCVHFKWCHAGFKKKNERRELILLFIYLFSPSLLSPP
jgi:hypothetical protein